MTTKLTPPGKRRTKHSALTDQLQELVVSLRPGDRLPPQDELMRRYRVSDSTVLRSLDDLQRLGWIVRRRGSGTFVTEPGARIAEKNAVVGTPIFSSGDSEKAAQARTITLIARYTFAASYLRLCADLLAEQAEPLGLSLICRAASSFSHTDISTLETPNSAGFVFLGYAMVDTAHELMARGHRVVVIGTPPANTDPVVPCVCADHDLGGYLAARHLLDGGHRRIAFAYDRQMPCAPENHPRWIGHQRAVNEAALKNDGAEIQSVLIDAETLARWRDNADHAAEYFGQKDAPTAIAAWNDSVALMLLGILHRTGRRVPDDISVIGFDAVPEGIDSVPPLTTVDQHMDWQVQTALRLLNRPTPPAAQTVMVLPELKTRSSCSEPLISKGKEMPSYREPSRTLIS